MGDDDVADRIYRGGINQSRIYGQREAPKPHQSLLPFSFGARFRFAPSKHAGSPDDSWIARKDRFSVSKTAAAVIT
jgi:hypothetical protein